MAEPARPHPSEGDALIVVDVQNDFLPGGALAVPDGDQVIAPINRLIALFSASDRPVYFSRDWHPAGHCSFLEQGGPWPPHCVADTPGADFAAGLELPAEPAVVSKGTRADRDAYSALDGTDLGGRLRAGAIRRVFVSGLATDYCVRATVLDALADGFEVVVLTDAVRAVDVDPGDGDRALEAMRDAGARLASGSGLAESPTAPP